MRWLFQTIQKEVAEDWILHAAPLLLKLKQTSLAWRVCPEVVSLKSVVSGPFDGMPEHKFVRIVFSILILRSGVSGYECSLRKEIDHAIDWFRTLPNEEKISLVLTDQMVPDGHEELFGE